MKSLFGIVLMAIGVQFLITGMGWIDDPKLQKEIATKTLEAFRKVGIEIQFNE